MSQNESAASGEASEEHPSGSVLDIFYCDARRVGAFLSQFDEMGIPTRVSVAESIQKARGRAFKFGLGGGIDGVGNANLNVERGPALVGGQESETREYDPVWANAFALLDYLESNDLVTRDLNRARIGQFVLVSGAMALMDLTLFKGIWSLEAVREAIKQIRDNADASQTQITSLNRQTRRAEQKHHKTASPVKSSDEIAMDAAFALVGMLPHTIQVRIRPLNESKIVWSTLRDENMVISSADLMLKHGTTIAGEWSMIGVLDAFPDADANGDLTQQGMEAALLSTTLNDSPFGQMMFHMLPFIRPLLGRPFSAYGMTPVLIYRRILS